MCTTCRTKLITRGKYAHTVCTMQQQQSSVVNYLCYSSECGQTMFKISIFHWAHRQSTNDTTDTRMYATQCYTIRFSVNDKTQFDDKLSTIGDGIAPWRVTELRSVVKSKTKVRHHRGNKQTRIMDNIRLLRVSRAFDSIALKLTIFPYQFTMKHVNIIWICTSFSITNEMRWLAVHLSLPMHKSEHSQHFIAANVAEQFFTNRINRLFAFLSFRYSLCLRCKCDTGHSRRLLLCT